MTQVNAIVELFDLLERVRLQLREAVRHAVCTERHIQTEYELTEAVYKQMRLKSKAGFM
jgi:hypothetical protein